MSNLVWQIETKKRRPWVYQNDSCHFSQNILRASNKAINLEVYFFKTVNVRRLAQGIAHYGPAIALIVLANVGCNQATTKKGFLLLLTWNKQGIS